MKRIISLILCILATQVQAQITPILYDKADKAKMNRWVDSVYNRLSDDERLGQLFMVIANPKSDVANMKRLIKYVDELKLGGILFHKGDPVTQADVTNRLQQISKVPLLVALDGEWGLSMRLSNTTRFPKNMMLGAIENDSLLYAYGQEVGRQCREMGIHINFAPALDVNSNTENPVIGLRSFGEDPDAVAEKGIAYAAGLESQGIISVAKHFPGHGDTAEDSHYTLPTVHQARSRLDSVELFPFKKYIQSGFAGIMTAHLKVPALDKSKEPTSLSSKIVTQLLQKELGFTGLCFTDALAMKGASPRKEDNPSLKALLAGNDILLAPATPFSDFGAIKAMISEGKVDKKIIEDRCRKVLQYKYIAGLANYKPVRLAGLSARLNSSHANWLNQKLNAEAVTLLKNEADILPFKQLDKNKIAVLSLGEAADCDFQKTIACYDSVAGFHLSRQATAREIAKVYTALEKYDIIICGIHSVRIPESASLRKLITRKQVIYAFFTSPYFTKEYKASLRNAKAVLMAYENTPAAQQYAAQLLFGGIAAKGKLPVSIPTLYYAGTGIFTEKTRLGYFEPEEVEINPMRLSEIDTIVTDGLKNKAYPGCQVLVAKDGMIIYNKAFGSYDYSGKQDVTVQSVYDLASSSKAAGTLLAVMKAYDEKKFTLNSKISEFIPQLKKSDKADLRIKELLYHQSGVIPTINFYMNAIDKDSYKGSLYSGKRTPTYSVQFDARTYVRPDFAFLPELVSFIPKEGYTEEVARNIYLNPTFKDTIIQEIKKSKLRNRGRYKYSCVNFIMLKLMVENQMKQRMDHLLYDNFYSRLGATTTRYTPVRYMDSLLIVPTEQDNFLRKQTLRGYVHDEAAAFQGGVSGNAGLFSNANDLAKVLQMYLNAGSYGGEEYLSAATTRLFTQSKSPTCRRGLGFDKPDGGGIVPLCTYGHTGYTGTCFWVDPSHNLIYIFLSNRVHPNRSNNKLMSMEIRSRIQEAIYKSFNSKTRKD
ncbi:glycoside hydrolase family 3 N-terminal domain-containing protein [Parabacteroides pacaensis]|uniref:glycoside hydrolase family 3 N-terminal domain-containing protein n=1 Tax=Parabacteroides pacaensis TaxID=2086575 RepID=UPI000D104F00|nr:glycoside hydrolase family 3 N-terminal domain-containing protein [Parabacteroides pacaensis]